LDQRAVWLKSLGETGKDATDMGRISRSSFHEPEEGPQRSESGSLGLGRREAQKGTQTDGFQSLHASRRQNVLDRQEKAMSTVTNRPKQRRVTDFVDMQVATLIRNHADEELCIEDLVAVALKEMPGFEWKDDKIRHSVNRLEKRGRLASKYVVRSKRLCRVPYLI
jgi:hypothetical protein